MTSKDFIERKVEEFVEQFRKSPAIMVMDYQTDFLRQALLEAQKHAVQNTKAERCGENDRECRVANFGDPHDGYNAAISKAEAKAKQFLGDKE